MWFSVIKKSIRRFFRNGRRNKLVGGVLPSVLALLVIFSLVFSHKLKSYRNEMRLYQQTKQFYLGKTLEALTTANVVKEYQKLGVATSLSGEERYNVGNVTYSVKNQTLVLQVELASGLSYQETIELDNEGKAR